MRINDVTFLLTRKIKRLEKTEKRYKRTKEMMPQGAISRSRLSLSCLISYVGKSLMQETDSCKGVCVNRIVSR